MAIRNGKSGSWKREKPSNILNMREYFPWSAFGFIHTATCSYQQGINTFDTADVYSNGLSEEILGRAIKKLNLPREEIVIMTKVKSFGFLIHKFEF